MRGHRVIAQFSRVGGIVDDRYSVRVSSSDCSRKAIVCQVKLLNGGFRAVVVSPVLGMDSRDTFDWDPSPAERG